MLQLFKDNIKLFCRLSVFAIFVILICVFFGGSFLKGKVINGIDGNYAYRSFEKQQLEESGPVAWSAIYWLGQSRIYNINTKYIFRILLPMRWEMFADLAFVMLIGSIFTYLLLRRFGLDRVSGIFAAIAYSFAPHYITLVYPCHTGPLNSMAYTPMLFYFLTVSFNKCSESPYKKWGSALLAGLAWGMVMNEDPQRGLYISVVAAIYALYRGWIYTTVSAASPIAILKQRKTWGLLIRGSAILAIFFLIFYHNFQIQVGGKNVKGSVAGIEQNQSQSEEQKWQFATSWSLNPRELADSLAPGYHGSLSGDTDKPYWGARPVAHSSDSLGFFVVVFGILGAVVGFRRDKNCRFFVIAATLATLLAFGKYLPGRPLFWLWYQLPMMDKFRAPAKFMCVTAFSMSILAGFGLQYLINSLRENSRLAGYFQKALLALLGVGIVWFIYLIGNEQYLRVDLIAKKLGGNEELARIAFKNALLAVLRMDIYIFLSIIVLWLARRFREFPWRVGIVAYIFALFLVFDLFSIDQYYLQKSLIDPDQFFVKDEVIQTVQSDDEPYRVTTNLKIEHQGRMVPLSLTAVGNHYITYLFPYFQIESFDNTPQSRVASDYSTFFQGMLDGIPKTQNPKLLVKKMVDDNIRLWRLCNVRYLITDGNLYGLSRRPIPIMEQLKRHPDLEFVRVAKGFAGRQQAVFRVRDVLPRFAFYTNLSEVDNGSQTLKVLDSPNFDMNTNLVVIDNSIESLNTSNASHFISPRILDYKPGYAHIDIDAPSSGILVMNSRYNQDWRVSIDGHLADTFKANFIMTAVILPEGKHIVEFEYDPESSTLVISMATIVVVLSVCLLLPLGTQIIRQLNRKSAAKQSCKSKN